MIEGFQRIRPGHRPAEGLEVAEVIGEAFRYHVHHLARHGIGREAMALRGRHVLRQ